MDTPPCEKQKALRIPERPCLMVGVYPYFCKQSIAKIHFRGSLPKKMRFGLIFVQDLYHFLQIWPCMPSQDNTDQPSGTLVDDPLQGLPQLFPGVLRHTFELALQVLPHQLMEGSAKDVGVPDLPGISLELTE